MCISGSRLWLTNRRNDNDNAKGLYSADLDGGYLLLEYGHANMGQIDVEKIP